MCGTPEVPAPTGPRPRSTSLAVGGGAPLSHSTPPGPEFQGPRSPRSGRGPGEGLQEAPCRHPQPPPLLPPRPGPPLLHVTSPPGPWAPAAQGTSPRQFISLSLPVTIHQGGPVHPVLAAEEAGAQRGCLSARGHTAGRQSKLGFQAAQSGVRVAPAQAGLLEEGPRAGVDVLGSWPSSTTPSGRPRVAPGSQLTDEPGAMLAPP